MKHHYVTCDPAALDLRVRTDDPRATTTYQNAMDASEAASALGAATGRQLSIRGIETLPKWVTQLHNGGVLTSPGRRLVEDGPADRLHRNTTHSWVNLSNGTRITIEADKKAPPPWERGAEFGTLSVINGTGLEGPREDTAESIRETLLATISQNGKGWLIARAWERLYWREVNRDANQWVGTGGAREKERPGGIIGGLSATAEEITALRDETVKGAAAEYLKRVQYWWVQDCYRVRMERLHACAECERRHWSSTQLSPPLYGKSDAWLTARLVREVSQSKDEWSETQDEG